MFYSRLKTKLSNVVNGLTLVKILAVETCIKFHLIDLLIDSLSGW